MSDKKEFLGLNPQKLKEVQDNELYKSYIQENIPFEINDEKQIDEDERDKEKIKLQGSEKRKEDDNIIWTTCMAMTYKDNINTSLSKHFF